MASTTNAFRCHRGIISKDRCGVPLRQKLRSAKCQGVPPELWHHTFSFLQDEKADLANLTLVSKSFASIAQPLIFQHMIIRPVCGKHPSSGRLICRLDHWRWVVERIQFCTQERIAHAVTSIEFSPTVNPARREWNGTEIATAAETVIRTLSAFPRLKSFRCAYLILQPHHIDAIFGAPSLRSFHTVNCHLSDDFHDLIHKLRTEEFTMAWENNASDLLGVTLSSHSHQRWFLLIHPDHVRTLNLTPLDVFHDRMLEDLVDSGMHFHALRSLGLSWMAVESKSFVPLLGRAPLLQELRFVVRPSHRTIFMANPLPRHVIQNLSVLEAPVHALAFLLGNRSPQDLFCTAMRDEGILPAEIVTAFNALPEDTFRKLEKLTLEMKCLSDELLDCLVRRVPRVTVLSLDVRGIAWGPTPGSLESHTARSTVAFFLSLQLPRTLEYLYIGKRYATATRSHLRQLSGDGAVALRSHFLSIHPSLKEAHFYAANFRMIYERGKIITTTGGRP